MNGLRVDGQQPSSDPAPAGHPPLARRARKTSLSRFWTGLLLVLAISSAIQLMLGADWWVLFCIDAAVIIAMAPIGLFGLSHSCSALLIVVGGYWGADALVVKSVFLQRVDTQLFLGPLSFELSLVFAIGVSFAALAAWFLVSGRRTALVKWSQEPPVMRRMAKVFLVITLAGFALATLPGGKAIGAIIGAYFSLVIILEVGATVKASGGRRVLSTFGLIAVGVTVLASLAANSKMGIFISFAAFLFTVPLYGRKVNVAKIAVAAFLFALISSSLFNAIAIERERRETVSAADLISSTLDTTVGLIIGRETDVNRYNAMMLAMHAADPATYTVLYFNNLPLVFERFLMQPYADAILRNVEKGVGSQANWSTVTRQLSGLVPIIGDKDPVYIGDMIARNTGLTDDPYFAGFLTVGLPSEAYYVDGWTAVLVLPFVLFLLIFLELAFLVGDLRGNPFGIFVLVRHIHFAAVGVSGGILFLVGRQIPTDAVLFYLMARWARGEIGRGRLRSPAG